MRFKLFDSVRGFALILMAIYHFCFDLNYFGVIHQEMNLDPFWLWFRVLIMTLFVGLVGISLSLNQTSNNSKSNKRRLEQLFVCALLISIGTYFIFPESWTFFGVLHFIFLATLLCRPLKKYPRISLVLGIAIVAVPNFYRNLFFQQKWLVVSGLGPLKPQTEDFAPFAPWLGVVLIGIYIGFIAFNRKWAWLQTDSKYLSKLGQHSLLFYMAHQFVLFPIAWVINELTK